jgi:hypothetical protein
VSVEAYNPTNSTWEVLATTTASSSVYAWRGYNLYYWDAGSLMVPAVYWTPSGTAQVKAVGADGKQISSLRPDWTTCMGTTTTAQQFVQTCGAASNPVANLTAASADLTLYVDSTVNASGDGTSAHPFQTIGQGINAAVAYTGGRKRVQVATGYYVETVYLSPGVDLVSPRTGAAIINGNNSRATGAPTVFGVHDSSLSGFVITGGYGAGVSMSGSASGTHVFRNIIRGNYGAGIVCTYGCNALIENNTVIGNLRPASGSSSAGILVISASPTVRNNLVFRQDLGISSTGSTGSESYDLSYDNNTNFYNTAAGTGSVSVNPGFVDLYADDFRLAATSAARHAGNPTTFNGDGTRADLGAFDGNGGYTISLAAQEWAVESIFGAYYDLTGTLSSHGARTPITGNPTFFINASIAGNPALSIVEGDVTRAVQELSVNAATPVFSSGTPPSDACHTWSLFESESSTDGATFLDSWSVVNNACIGSTWGGRVIGGQVNLSSGVLQALLAPSGNDSTPLHEAGHAYGGVYHCFRTVSPMAYGGSPASDFTPVETEALALRASDIGTYYTGIIPMADWFQKGYLTQAVLHPFPAIETINQNASNPAPLHYGAQSLIQGSRFTMAVSSEDGSAYLPSDYALPLVYFNSMGVPITTGINWQGGLTRNIYAVVPPSATSGWLTVRARGLESIPVRTTVGP